MAADDCPDTWGSSTACVINLPSGSPAEASYDATIAHPTGKPHSYQDYDWFRINVPASPNGSNGVLEVWTTGDVDTYGMLYDHSGTYLTEADSGGAGTNFRIVRGNIDESTYYRLKVNASRWAEGAYTVHVRITWDDHGDDCSTATPISCNGSLSGNIVYGGDVDFFKFDIPANTSVHIYTTGSTPTHGVLYDTDCNNIAFNSPASGNFSINHNFTAAGVYYAEVQHASGTGTGTYTLNLDCVSLFTITTAVNGTGGTITPVGPRTYTQGSSDTFTISANAGMVINQLIVDGARVMAAYGQTTYSVPFTGIQSDHSITVSFHVPGSSCLDMSDSAMDALINPAPPLVMFVLDDSGSMDWEILMAAGAATGADGRIGISGTNYSYVFDDAGTKKDNLYTTSSDNGKILSGDNRRYYKTQWAAGNKLYYDPLTTYAPWVGKSNADPNSPKKNPVQDTGVINLADAYLTLVAGAAIIVNETDTGSVSSTGSWVHYENRGAEVQNGDYYSSSNNSGPHSFRWTPTLPVTGTYKVFVKWRSSPSRLASVPYMIQYQGGSATINVNQRNSDGNAWVQIGASAGYTFQAGSVNYIEINYNITDPSNERICADAVMFEYSGAALTIPNAHYFVTASNGAIYLITLGGSVQYYQFIDSNSNNYVDNSELLPVAAAAVPADVQVTRTYAEERQNFANWYSFYRKRRLTATAALCRIISDMQGIKAGILSINHKIKQTVLAMKWNGSDDSGTLINELQTMTWSADGTPLRIGYNDVGHYLDADDGDDGNLGTAPWSSSAQGGECQKAFAIIMTDGYDNGGFDENIGNVDLGNDHLGIPFGHPYSDSYSNTLGDISMKWWDIDLNLTLANSYPDANERQHLITFGLSFGAPGIMTANDIALGNWTDPFGTDQRAKIDDLIHATVNGRGAFYDAASADELQKALEGIMSSIEQMTRSSASISVSGNNLYEYVSGSVHLFQSQYTTGNWTGDVKAFGIDPVSGAIASTIWSAETVMETVPWTNRIIATYNPSLKSGEPFTWSNLTGTQQNLLNNNTALLNYLRGDASQEKKNGGGYRNRYARLGDIIHSSPVFHKSGALFVGGNDGMLHVFNADSGAELFAYVPNLVFDHLRDLSDPTYAHKYYVDLTPLVLDISVNGTTQTLLVGGLGKGGKGYYALDMTDPFSITSESGLAGRVKWEFSDTNDLGYSFSAPAILKTRDQDHPWVVVFGNGYGSLNEKAVLFVIDAQTGDVLNKIDTGAGGLGYCNGLSSPAPADIDADGIADCAYAGDLLGNLWKFNLSADQVVNWGISYGLDNGNGVINASDSGDQPQPLFTAQGPGNSAQSITTAPDVTLHPSGLGCLVIFGTGKFLGQVDLDLMGAFSVKNTIYGIWDFGDNAHEYLGSFDRLDGNRLTQLYALDNTTTATLLEQDIVPCTSGCDSTGNFWVINGTKHRKATSNRMSYKTYQKIIGGSACTADGTGAPCDPDDTNSKPDPAQFVGWYLDLPIDGERLVSDVLIREGKVIIISYIPDRVDPCKAKGTSVLMELSAFTGGATNRVVADINTAPPEPPKDWVIDEVSIGRLQPPAILIFKDQGEENKYLSSSTGVIVIVKEKSPHLGVASWKEIR
jgi:Tfp pilus tip-associated adhesin PilY1